MSEPTKDPGLEAERGLIGCCLIDGFESANLAKTAGVTAASFLLPFHQKVWSAIDETMRQGAKTTPDAVILILSERGILHGSGAHDVNQLLNAASTTANLRLFIGSIRGAELSRNIHKSAGKIDELASERPIAPEDLISGVQQEIAKALNWSVEETQNWRVKTELAINAIGSPEEAGVSFGFSDMDRIFFPMKKGQLVVIAGRPSVGKSSLMRQIAMYHAQAGHRVFIASLEVKAEEIAYAMAAVDSGISYNDVTRGMHKGDVETFYKSLRRIAELPLIVVDNFSASSETIIARARAEHQRQPLALVCVDHLHLLPDIEGSKNVTKADAIGKVTKAFKALSGELKIPVILLSQLNRENDRDERPPRLSDLRSSGSIEQDGDKVILLHRPPVDGATKLPQNETSDAKDHPRFYTDLVQAKGRGAGTSALGVYFNRPITRFEQIRLGGRQSQSELS